MKEMKILHSYTYSLYKASFVERFNQTFQGLMSREQAMTGGKKWINLIDQVMYKYNYVNVHSFIKMTPASAELDKNQIKISKLFKKKYKSIKWKSPKFKEGDIVKIYRQKGTWPRSYHQDYTDENFIVNKVLVNLPKPRYELKDFNGEVILGNFQEGELSKYDPPSSQPQIDV